MALWSKKKKEEPKDLVVELEFDKSLLYNQLEKLARSFYDYRHEESHKDFAAFIEKSLNMEVLNLATQKEVSSESYQYQRGKIDGIRNILLSREQVINTIKQSKATEKTKNSHAAKRSYVSRPRVSGGMSD